MYYVIWLLYELTKTIFCYIYTTYYFCLLPIIYFINTFNNTYMNFCIIGGIIIIQSIHKFGIVVHINNNTDMKYV